MIATFSAADQLRRPRAREHFHPPDRLRHMLMLKSTCVGALIRSDNHPSAARPKGAPQTPLTLRVGRADMPQIGVAGDLVFARPDAIDRAVAPRGLVRNRRLAVQLYQHGIIDIGPEG